MLGGVKLRWFGLAFGTLGAAAAYLLFLQTNLRMHMPVLLPGKIRLTPTLLQKFWRILGNTAVAHGDWLRGLLGLGLGQSRQKYLYLPEPQNDFIFSIVCEELGFIGALIVIVLFAMLIWRGITVSLRAKDKFGMMLGVGLTVQIGIQVILNIMVVTNTIPNTGISLPFFQCRRYFLDYTAG